ncbi:MAG: adenosylcobinamide-GDP ribazoletransferase [Pseudomonadota bacterium]
MLKSVTGSVRQRIEELQLAFALLTRFPVPRGKLKTRARLTTAFWAYPIAGAAVGCFGAQVFWLAHRLEVGDVPAVVLALSAMTLATGAFHEDGLADFWDAIGGGKNRQHKLSIMRDSRLGTYGVIALILYFALNIFLLTEIYERLNAESVIHVMICLAILARLSFVIPILSLYPARQDGLAVAAATPPLVSVAFGFLFFIGISTYLLGVWLTCVVCVGAAFGAVPISMMAYYYLRGYTGDVLGATAMTSQSTALIAVLIGMSVIAQ